MAGDYLNISTLIGTIFRDLTAVKQPDESFFQALSCGRRPLSIGKENPKHARSRFPNFCTIFRGQILRNAHAGAFGKAVVLNTKFCTGYSDFTLHWTDKDSMREVRSLTSEYNILSPGVLGLLKDIFERLLMKTLMCPVHVCYGMIEGVP